MTLNSRSAKLSSPNVKVQDVPNKPTIGSVAQDPSANAVNVSFTPAATGGQAAVYRAISSPGNIEGISYGSSPVQVSDLSDGVSYTFAVRGETSTGATTGYSESSQSITTSFGAMELISTTILASDTASVTFDISAYASTYKHLQIRTTVSAIDGTNNRLWGRFNGATSGYSEHFISTGAASVSSSADTALNGMRFIVAISDASTAGSYSAGTIDILDPFSSAKNKTVRSFSGTLFSGYLRTFLQSFAWYSTSPVTSISLASGNTGFGQGVLKAGSRFSIYGIKG